MDKQLVIFDLANESYGLEIASVESIIKLQPITTMPKTPQFVEGVTNLRGKVLPVIDLRNRFGFSASEPGKSSRIIVVNMNGYQIGMVVDAVSEVVTIQEDSIEPPPSVALTVDSSFITGIAKIGSRLIILLDLEQVLSFEEQASLQTFTSSAD